MKGLKNDMAEIEECRGRYELRFMPHKPKFRETLKDNLGFALFPLIL